MLQPLRLLPGLLCTLLLLLLASSEAAAQVDPDTVYRKPELPVGPPAPVEQPRPQQRPAPRRQPAPRPEVVVTQEQPEFAEEPRLVDRLYTGGSFGLQFGTFTNISLLPILGYKVTERYRVGVGLVYQFYKSSGISLNNYGGRAFTQLELVDIGDGALLAHAEVEVLNAETLWRDQYGRLSTRRNVLTLPMAGLGYRQRLSEKASFDILALYNINDSPLNPYSNPVLRFGFNISLGR